MSLQKLAAFLNRDRNTVQKYIDQGMPVVERADRDRGIHWVTRGKPWGTSALNKLKV